ncbi:MAG: DNA methyltransferase [Nitrospirota bacterium]
MQAQLTLFEESAEYSVDLKTSRSGTFVDNLSLPVHRWFRYSAGFAAQWVEQVLADWGIKTGGVVLDPFVGSGTVPVVCDTLGIESVGIEAHPIVARICRTKLLWTTPVDRVAKFAEEVLNRGCGLKHKASDYAPLIQRSFDENALAVLTGLKESWSALQDKSPESELVWLALTAILRPTSKAGTAQWQYILPNKTKSKVLAPLVAFQQQIEMMKSDMRWMQRRVIESKAQVIAGDARNLSQSINQEVDAVITSPPYANNYDYADALRFEMTFWGEVSGWGDIHEAVRKHLIVSSSQHSSRERLKPEALLATEEVKPIRDELAKVVRRLSTVRENYGGKKHYHTMIAAYCRDISLVLRQLRQVCKPGARMCWVIGDSAPYGVYCPVEAWIGELALDAGFKRYQFEKLRDRNIKWKNRKHRVPLKEGLLWIEA